MKGRRPIPSHLKRLRGNPGRRPLNTDEPEPGAVATPDPPPGLTKQAREVWMLLIPQLITLGVMADVDRLHLSRACKLEGLGRTLLRRAEKEPIVETPANGRQPSAELSAALRCFESADRIFLRFGITPSERTRIKIDAKKPHDLFEGFQKRRAEIRLLRPNRNVNTKAKAAK